MDNLIILKESFLVVLDSRNASKYLNSSWNSSVSFEFEDPIKQDDYTLQMNCSVLNFSASNSIYNINETNSYLSITASGLNYNINIPFGNYNFNTLQATIYNLGLSNIKLSLNYNSNIISFSDSIDSSFSINGTSTLLYILGGVVGTTYNSQTLNSFQVLTMPYQCNFNGINNINIYMTNINTKNIDSYSKTNGSIIQSIQVFPYTPQIMFNKKNDYSFSIKQDIISFIQIDIKDDLERFINFNNSTWNLTLCFTVTKEVPRQAFNFHTILLNGYQTFH